VKQRILDAVRSAQGPIGSLDLATALGIQLGSCQRHELDALCHAMGELLLEGKLKYHHESMGFVVGPERSK